MASFNKIYIGKHKEHGALYLEKHNWDCGWYWGFGYIGNKNLHTHFDGVFLKDTKLAKEVMPDSKFSDTEWWIIRDLFIQAYALKNVAAVYRHGGHQTTLTGITDIIKDETMEQRVNKDLEIVLNKIWDFMCAIANK
jgi:hypothetical protein